MPRAIKLKFVRNLRVKPRKQTSPSRAPYPDEHDDEGLPTREAYTEYLRNEIRSTPPDLTAEIELLCSELRGVSRRT
jgi:hypothetical protein